MARVQRSSLLRLMIFESRLQGGARTACAAQVACGLRWRNASVHALVKGRSNHEKFQAGAIDGLAGAINVTRHGGRRSVGVEFCRAEGLGFPQN